MPEASPLPVTERTRHRRLREQGSTDRRDLADILAAGVICHLGVVVDGSPMVVPTVYGLAGDTLYLHGSVASRSLVSAPQATICVTVTHVDGLVLARSVFEHAVNYRSAMIYGTPRLVTDREEKLAGLRSLAEHIVPGQWDYARRPNKKELAKTSLLALSLDEASVKIRTRPARRRRLPRRGPAGLGRRPPAGRRLAGPGPRPRATRRASRCPRTSPPWPTARWDDRHGAPRTGPASADVSWRGQPRLPDPSCGSPAPVAVPEDKSGLALARIACFLHRDH